MGGHWTLAQVPYSSTLSTVCILYAPRWFPPISARHPLKGLQPPSLTYTSLSKCNRADRYRLCRRENSCRGRAMVAALLRGPLPSGLHYAAAFVLGTQGTCPPEQSMLHLPLAGAHQPKSQPKVLATSNLWITGSKRKCTLRRHHS